MQSMIEPFVLTFGVVCMLFLAGFVLSIIVRKNSVVDPLWGVGFIAAAVFSYWAYGHTFTQLLATSLVAAWGVRLSSRLLLRNWGKPEDWRYATWREQWGPKWFYARSLVQVFLFQAVLCFVIVLPVLFMNIGDGEELYSNIVALGLGTWVLGFFFESVGDYQLDRFIAGKPKKGAVLDTGLWRFTRHPNYFGEATQWWGLWLIAMGCGLGAWWTIIGPLAITFLLLKVSGIPLLEKKMSQNPAYREYMKHTNKFLPAPPK